MGTESGYYPLLFKIAGAVFAMDNRASFKRTFVAGYVPRIPDTDLLMGNAFAAEAWLQDFHRRTTGATSAAFGHRRARSRVAGYASSYDALTSRIPDSGGPLTVLDLACGDGHLLKLLCARQQPLLRLIGIDISEHELRVARTVLPESVVLLKERAQALSIDNGSVDFVLSHMALMLMDDIETVLREVRRVLRPQGKLAAIVGRTFLLGEVNEIFLSVFRPIAKEDALAMPFGDRRTGTERGWTELLEPNFGNLRFEDIDVDWAPHPDELWNALTETYDIDRLSVSAKGRLRERLLDAISPLLQSDGTIHTGWGLRLVSAQAL